MRLPFVQSGVVDTIIAALRTSGLIANDTSANALRNAPAQMTEADRDSLAASLAYGSTASDSDKIVSTGNTYALVDSDNSGTSPYINYFQVIKGQTYGGGNNARRQIMSVGGYDSGTQEIQLYLGPPGDFAFGGSGDYPVKISLGGHVTGGYEPFGTITAGQTAVGGTASGVSYRSHNATEIVHGSASSPNGLLYIRKWDQGVTTSLQVQQQDDQTIILRTAKSAANTDAAFYISGTYPNPVDDARIRFAIGGTPGSTTGQDPRVAYPLGGGYNGSAPVSPNAILSHAGTMLVVSPDMGGAVPTYGFKVWHKSDTLLSNEHYVNFHSNLDMGSGNPNLGTVRLLSVTAYHGVERCVAFEVRGNRLAYAASFVTTGIDVAEAFEALDNADTYKPGTVMCLTEEGPIQPSNAYADSKVVGVISTSPGVHLGGEMEGIDKAKTVYIAMAGTVPVRASTAHGNIPQGALLVSAEGGLAGLAPVDAAPGVIIGKALEALSQPGDAAVEGTIKMLVLNR